MKKQLSKISTKKIVWMWVIFSIFALSIVFASGSWYRINNWVSNLKAYVNGGWNYKVVTNTSWLNLFVPTKTTSELDNFCNNWSWTSCYSCNVWGWLNDGYRSNTIDHDTGAWSVGHSQAYCANWCRNILDWAKDTWQHWCVRRSNGRCHLYRDDVSHGGYESWRSRFRMDCINQS